MMKKNDVFSAIKHALSVANKGDQTVTVQLQIIKYYSELKGLSAREFVEEVGLKPSLVTLFTDSMKLARKLTEAGMNKDKL